MPYQAIILYILIVYNFQMVIRHKKGFFDINVFTERKGFLSIVHEYVESSRIVQIVSDLIERRSDSDGDMEYSVALYLQEFLSSLGLEVHLQHIELKRYNVIARLAGKPGGKTLMYAGHIDVVPPGNEENWVTPPFSAHVTNGKIYGRGSTDMKGSIASMLHTIELFVSHEVRLGGDVLLVFVVDEETTNKGMRYFLTTGVTADACIVGEPTDMQIAIGHKGVLGIWLTLHGKRAHSATPENGINTISHASKVIQKVESYQENVLRHRLCELLGNPTMTVTMIRAGKELNSVPQQCDLRIDRRLIPGETKETCLSELETLLAELKIEVPEFSYTLKTTTFCPPWKIPEDHPVVGQLRGSINPEEPESVPVGIMSGTCEATLIDEIGNIPVIILGPGRLSEAHIENEFVSIEDLVAASKSYARLIMNYLGCELK